MKEGDRITSTQAKRSGRKKKSWSEWECDWEGTWDRGGLAVMMGRWERGKKWELCYAMGEGRGCEAGNKEREKREL